MVLDTGQQRYCSVQCTAVAEGPNLALHTFSGRYTFWTPAEYKTSASAPSAQQRIPASSRPGARGRTFKGRNNNHMSKGQKEGMHTRTSACTKRKQQSRRETRQELSIVICFPQFANASLVWFCIHEKAPVLIQQRVPMRRQADEAHEEPEGTYAHTFDLISSPSSACKMRSGEGEEGRKPPEAKSGRRCRTA